MLRALTNRLVQFVIVLVLVTFGTTALGDLLPGSPATTVLGEYASKDAIANFNHKYGFDQPLFERYWHWLTGALHGDLGESITAQIPVTDMIRKAFPVTLEISLSALILSLVLGIGLALLSALRPGGMFDRTVSWLSSGFYALPEFVSAVFIVLLFSTYLDVLPPLGWVPLSESVGGNITHAILPILTLTITGVTVPLRILRGDLAAVLNDTYIVSARARGLPEWYILLRHAFRPASSSLLTIIGVVVGFTLAGSIIVETFYTLPGFGMLFSAALSGKDIVVTQGLVVVVALIYMFANLVVDLCQPLVDPRLRSSATSARS